MTSRRTPEEIQAQRDPRADQSLREVDPALNAILEREAVRQRDHIELIASENYAYAAVREAQGTILTNKYAEGYRCFATFLPGYLARSSLASLAPPDSYHIAVRVN